MSRALRWWGGLLALVCLGQGATALTAGATLGNTNQPPRVMRLVFIHHSTGENWLADGYGGLGLALRDNDYFVSDTNYGWGPDSVGDTTDIGHWWRWFRGPDSARYLAALYAETNQNCEYSRRATAPPGPNEIVMFKSCFPNSALRGNAADSVPAIDNNPLRGLDSGSDEHTVANAKGIYVDLLHYFATMTNKLFVAITAPPLSDPTDAANARAFNEWLIHDWLAQYPHPNVFVWDFYDVLTSNGANSGVNDLGRETGNHHRWWRGAVQHKTDGGGNVSAYPSALDDDHPSAAGSQKATAEFIPLLNSAVNAWLNPRPAAPGFAAVQVAGPTVELAITYLSPGATYILQRRPDLVAGGWLDAMSFTAVATTTNYTESVPNASGKMFYQLIGR